MGVVFFAIDLIHSPGRWFFRTQKNRCHFLKGSNFDFWGPKSENFPSYVLPNKPKRCDVSVGPRGNLPKLSEQFRKQTKEHVYTDTI